MTGLAFIQDLHMKRNLLSLQLAGSGGNPLAIMIAYASSVAVALIGITLLSFKVFKYFQHKITYFSKYLSKDYFNVNSIYDFRYCNRIIIRTLFRVRSSKDQLMYATNFSPPCSSLLLTASGSESPISFTILVLFPSLFCRSFNTGFDVISSIFFDVPIILQLDWFSNEHCFYYLS